MLREYNRAEIAVSVKVVPRNDRKGRTRHHTERSEGTRHDVDRSERTTKDSRSNSKRKRRVHEYMSVRIFFGIVPSFLSKSYCFL